jgi:hypothetical protein
MSGTYEIEIGQTIITVDNYQLAHEMAATTPGSSVTYYPKEA